MTYAPELRQEKSFRADYTEAERAYLTEKNLYQVNSIGMSALGVFGLPALATRMFGGPEAAVSGALQFGFAAADMTGSLAAVRGMRAKQPTANASVNPALETRIDLLGRKATNSIALDSNLARLDVRTQNVSYGINPDGTTFPIRTAATNNLITEKTIIKTKGIDEQVSLIANMVPGLKRAQAEALLRASFNTDKPVEVVLGGSRIRNFFGQGEFRATGDNISDLDIGFNAKMSNRQVDRILDQFDSAGSLKSEKAIKISSGNKPPSGYIESPQQFFQHSGLRYDGTPYRPSGYISVHPDGTITIAPPIKH